MAAGLIRSAPSIMMGKPVVAGTRTPVESILEKLAAGETIERLLEAHPQSLAGVGDQISSLVAKGTYRRGDEGMLRKYHQEGFPEAADHP